MTNRPDEELEELLRQIGDVVEGRKKPEPTEQPVRNFSNGYGTRRASGSAAIPAYNPDFEAACRAGTVPVPEYDTPEEDTGEYRRDAAQAGYDGDYADDEDYAGADDLPLGEYLDGYSGEEPEEEPIMTDTHHHKGKKKRRRGCGCTTMLLLLAIVVGGVWLALSSIIRPPHTDDPIGPRKSGAVTILLCGTDLEGTRTDTMMLLYINPKEDAVNLISLPRDTLTHTTAGNNAKLNSAFGRNNGKEDPQEGMENLMLYVKDIIGYKPDGYMLISLEGFVDIVDAMGGVEFNVPQDMYYSDPSQGLHIDLEEGLQTLSGYDAMCLVRFRKGYANQDLGRVSVQRQFLSACMDQWVSISNLSKLPEILSVLKLNSTTDLSTGNMLWLALGAWRAGLGNIQNATLPGYATDIDGGSYYVLYPGEVAELINETCNPYKTAITGSDLNIVN